MYGERLTMHPLTAQNQNSAQLNELLRAQFGMRSNHVFGNVPCENGPRDDGLPWMPLENAYVEPNVLWKKNKKGLALNLIQKTLKDKASVVVVDQGFGAGKSLTARTLAWKLSESYLLMPTQGLFFPVFAPCDSYSHIDTLKALLVRNLRSVWSHRLQDNPSGQELLDTLCGDKGRRVVWILDGFDELGASETFTKGVLGEILAWLDVYPKHRFVILCRSHTADTLCQYEDVESLQESGTLQRFSLCHFDRDQREDWIERWLALCSDDSTLDKLTLSREDRETLLTQETYDVPMLLLMGVLAATDQGSVNVPLQGPKVMLYEFFCTWVATGRWRTYQRGLHSLTKQAQQLRGEALFDGLVFVDGWGPEIKEERVHVAALLFLLSRLAWESIVREQMARRAGEERDFDLLDRQTLEQICSEFGWDNLSTLSSVLLSAQGSSTDGAKTFLFGHKSFREYLAVRFHLSVLTHMASKGINSSNEAAQPYTEIIGSGDLLDYSGATRDFLLGASTLPTVSAMHERLLQWCKYEYEDPKLVLPNSESVQAAYVNERRMIWRLIAVATCASLSSVNNRYEISRRAICELIAIHFLRIKLFARQDSAALILRHVFISGADLSGMNLSGVDLSDADLSGANLSRADLSKANLNRIKLCGAKLRGTRLRWTKLRGADLSGADLSGTNLNGTNLSGTNLSRSNLSESDLSGVNLSKVDLSGANLREAKLNGADLSDSDLSETNLSGADLRRANLSRANLTESVLDMPHDYEPRSIFAKLRGAKLTGANLNGLCLKFLVLNDSDLGGANLSKANLRGVNLSKVNLSGANLSGAKLNSSNLHGAKVNESNLSGADLSGANLSKVNLSKTNLSGTNLSRSNLSGADLSGTNLSKVNLSEANLSGSKLNDANLYGVDLRNADLQGARLDGADLRGADLRGSKLRRADLRRANLSGAELIGAILNVANLSGTNLSRADLSNASLEAIRYDEHTKWPEGFELSLRQ